MPDQLRCVEWHRLRLLRVALQHQSLRKWMPAFYPLKRAVW